MFPADRIAELRESKGITQKELAAELHISKSTISDYESNKRQPTVSALIQLSQFFDVSIEYLLGLTDVKASMRKLQEKLSTRSGPVPIDIIFQLEEDEKEVVGLLLRSYKRKSSKVKANK